MPDLRSTSKSGFQSFKGGLGLAPEYFDRELGGGRQLHILTRRRRLADSTFSTPHTARFGTVLSRLHTKAPPSPLENSGQWVEPVLAQRDEAKPQRCPRARTRQARPMASSSKSSIFM
ncbi:hypothetical protein NL676_016261 [Syzygium grande]|nr:hypothetical protein NL676_016261 [Syzygium grande]